MTKDRGGGGVGGGVSGMVGEVGDCGDGGEWVTTVSSSSSSSISSVVVLLLHGGLRSEGDVTVTRGRGRITCAARGDGGVLIIAEVGVVFGVPLTPACLSCCI